MTDDEKRYSVRRVGRKDRKKRLQSGGSLFPEDASEPFESPQQADEPDLEDDSPEDDIQAELTAFVDEALAAVPASLHETKSSVIYTPPEERFPQVAPPDKPKAAVQPPAIKLPGTQPKPPKPARRGLFRLRYRGDWRHNMIAFIFAIGTLFMCGYYVLLWQNPYTALNPLAPATPYIYVTATFLPPTPTVGGQGIIVPEFTEAATIEVIEPTSTPGAVIIPTPTIDPADAAILPAFVLAPSGVIYIPNDNGRGCDWASIAGTITGLQGEPLNSYVIEIIDVDDPTRLDARVFSGSAITFGEGGFEMPLGGAPQVHRYSVQLFSPAGVALSALYYVDTTDQCDQNVAIVNFIQQRPL